MSEWKLKRFWSAATVASSDDGYQVLLDGRPVRTPAKAVLAVPGPALAEAIAAEWQAQEEAVDPQSMPFTRMANAAIDKVTAQHGEVAQMIADYADSDLLCYRAEGPPALVQRQAEIWDPYLAWAAETLQADLVPRDGLMHQPQDAGALARLAEQTHALSAFELAAFHDLTSITGSIILGYATALNFAPADVVWQASRLDEDWQIEQWGADEEAAAVAALKKQDFLHAKAFWDCVTGR